MTAKQREIIMRAIGKMTPELQRGIAIGIAAALEVKEVNDAQKTKKDADQSA